MDKLKNTIRLPRSVRHAIGIKLDQPAAAKFHAYIGPLAVGAIRGRMNIDYGRFQSHRHIRMTELKAFASDLWEFGMRLDGKRPDLSCNDVKVPHSWICQGGLIRACRA
ncbi:MAG TPA: hypothetical protein VGY56_22200 [Verrucomicrobiae bacterium]|nr:hypothetical protein [Verrucomicrobiae bacterium]